MSIKLLNIESFENKGFNLSKDTLEFFKIYFEEIQKWQNKMNLVSSTTLGDFFNRHILNSIQLLKYYEGKGKTIFDLGSGAGFPGLALSIMDVDNNYYLIESNNKKCAFLEHIIRKLNLANVKVLNIRVEDISNFDNSVDIIVSRAMASLDSLLILSNKLVKKGAVCLFLKGSKWQEEIDMCKSKLNFNDVSYETFDDIYLENSKVIKITNLTN